MKVFDIKIGADSLAQILRSRGVDVPSLTDDEGAVEYFGKKLKKGDRYLTTAETKKLMVYDGEKWIPQASM